MNIKEKQNYSLHPHKTKLENLSDGSKWIGLKRNYTVYVLKLQEEKYYVGVTYNPEKRIKTHGKKKGSKWTHIYKPVETVYQQEIGEMDYYDAEYFENYYTYLAIQKYGWENVRGGAFVQVEMNGAVKNGQMRRLKECYDTIKNIR